MKLPSCDLYKWILSSSNCGNLRQAKNHKATIFSAVPTPLFSTLAGLSCFIVPHFSFTQKLGLANLIFNSLFTRNQNLEEQSATQLDITRKEYLGKSFEGRQCLKLPSCSTLLKELVPPLDHPLVERLEALYRVVVDVFSRIMDQEFENGTSTWKRSWEPCERIISEWHQNCMCSSIMYQNMCAVPEFHSDLPPSRHWRFSIDFLIFSATDS